ncbi:MAG: CAP domain-containing protein [Clostridia bacterium]|nr:CAP domain-containing protein [Clostridia bacterium]
MKRKHKYILLTVLLLCVTALVVFCIATSADSSDVGEDISGEGSTEQSVEESAEPSDSSAEESTADESSELSTDESTEYTENSAESVSGEESAEQSVEESTEESAEESAEESRAEDESSDCEHDYKITVVEPTCINDGTKYYRCEMCKAAGSNRIPALGHEWGEWTVTVEPTETAEGTRERICKRCGVRQTEKIDKLESGTDTTITDCEHDYKFNGGGQPTCTEPGYIRWKCKLCGHTYTQNTDPATHYYGDWVTITAPTTESEGLEERTCESCGAKESRAIDVIRIPVTAEDAEWICNRILELLNEERAALGVGPLSTAPIAHEMAMVRAGELTEDFSHRRSASSKYPGEDSRTIYMEYQYNLDCLERTVFDGKEYNSCMPKWSSENIASNGFFKKDSANNVTDTKEDLAREIVENFKDSTGGHWRDLMNAKYTGVGIGVVITDVYDSIGRAYTSIMTMDKTYG